MANVLKDQINLQQRDSNTYSASYHEDWSLGPMLLGGSVAAILHSAAEKHFRTTLKSARQPDVQTSHVAFPRTCVFEESTIKVADLKVGKGSCYIQLSLSQDDEQQAIAIATSTNFDAVIGPSGDSEAGNRDDNYLPIRVKGDFVPLMGRMLDLRPRNGFPIPGRTDIWNKFDSPERIDASYLALMVDLIPSPGDTLTRGGGVIDANRMHAINQEWHANPVNASKPAIVELSVERALESAKIMETTFTMNLEWKRRIPPEGLGWVLARMATEIMLDGRLDLDVTLLDEGLKPVLSAHQVMTVFDISKRFGKGSEGTKL